MAAFQKHYHTLPFTNHFLPDTYFADWYVQGIQPHLCAQTPISWGLGGNCECLYL